MAQELIERVLGEREARRFQRSCARSPSAIPRSQGYVLPVLPAKMVGLDLGPACSQCGGVMQRTGSCYTCSSCGTNTGCR